MRASLGPPATLGSTLDAGLDLTGACTACRRVVIVDTEALEALALRYGRDAVLPDHMQRITCKGLWRQGAPVWACAECVQGGIRKSPPRPRSGLSFGSVGLRAR